MGKHLKILLNKKNNQLVIPISWKILNLKGKNPVSIELLKFKLKFEKIKRKRIL